jgi:hypothetical protein
MAKLDADITTGGLVPTPAFSRTATTSEVCGFIRPACRVVTRSATRTATPTDVRSRSGSEWWRLVVAGNARSGEVLCLR